MDTHRIRRSFASWSSFKNSSGASLRILLVFTLFFHISAEAASKTADELCVSIREIAGEYDSAPESAIELVTLGRLPFKTKPTLQEMQSILQEVLDKRYNGSWEQMKADSDGLALSSFRIPGGGSLTGMELLQLYSIANRYVHTSGVHNHVTGALDIDLQGEKSFAYQQVRSFLNMRKSFDKKRKKGHDDSIDLGQLKKTAYDFKGSDVERVIRDVFDEHAEHWAYYDAKVAKNIKVEIRGMDSKKGYRNTNLGQLLKEWMSEQTGRPTKEISVDEALLAYKAHYEPVRVSNRLGGYGIPSTEIGLRYALNDNALGKDEQRHFRDHFGRRVFKSETMSEEDFRTLRFGGPRDITYSPKAPTNELFSGHDILEKADLPFQKLYEKSRPTSKKMARFSVNAGYRFTDLTSEELDTFVRSHQLGDLVETLGDTPGALFDALKFSRPDLFTEESVENFVHAYVGIGGRVSRSDGDSRPHKTVDPWETRSAYIKGLIESAAYMENLDLSEAALRDQTNLIIHLSRLAHQDNPQKLIAELQNQARYFASEAPTDSALSKFLSEVHGRAADYFAKISRLKVSGLKTEPFPYQQEGIWFLAGREAAILADEPGLGKSLQAIAAAEQVGAKRVLWVTTDANKTNLYNEAKKHGDFKEEELERITSGNVKARNKQLETIHEKKHVYISYDTLVAVEKDKAAFKKLTEGIDTIIIDEAHIFDNGKTARAKTINKVKAKRRWLLTATPYKSDPARLFTLLNYIDPQAFPSIHAFKDEYLRSGRAGFSRLKMRLSQYMLRRTAAETLSYFEDPNKVPFEEQLAGNKARIPRIEEEKVETTLNKEHSKLIVEMIDDLEGWVERFNKNRPQGVKKISPTSLNPLTRFQLLHRAIYEPSYFGVEGDDTIKQAVKQNIEERLERGEKVILWAWNKDMVDSLMKEYEDYGVARLDGSVTGPARDKQIDNFQNKDAQVLVANYESGGVGLSLNAAHHAVMVQLPTAYPKLFQVIKRHQRVIGMKDIDRAKESVGLGFIIPKFHPEVLADVRDPELKSVLDKGTLAEQTVERLEVGEKLYELIMSSHSSPEQIDAVLKGGLTQEKSRFSYGRGATEGTAAKKKKKTKTVAELMATLWNRTKDPHIEERLARLTDELSRHPDVSEPLIEALLKAELGDIHIDDLDLILDIFNIRSRHVREMILRKLPDVVNALYERGQTLSKHANPDQIGALSGTEFLGQILIKGKKNSLMDSFIRRVLGEGDDLTREKLFVGLLGLEGTKSEKILWENNWPKVLDDPVRGVDLIHLAGLVARVKPTAISATPLSKGFASADKRIQGPAVKILAGFVGVKEAQVRKHLESAPDSFKTLSHLIALYANYKDHGDPRLMEQYREALHHIFAGTYEHWRENGPFRTGNKVGFLEGHPMFWATVSRPLEHTLKDVNFERANEPIDFLETNREAIERVEGVEQVREIEVLLAEKKAHDEYFERLQDEPEKTDHDESTVFNRMYSKRQETREHLMFQAKQLGRFLGGDRDEDTELYVKDLGLKHDDSIAVRDAVKAEKAKIENRLYWMNLVWGHLKEKVLALKRKAKLYGKNDEPQAAEFFERALNRGDLKVYSSGEEKLVSIDVRETHDWDELVRYGILDPELVHCMCPHGNPDFSQNIVTLLGSKNMNMLYVRENAQLFQNNFESRIGSAAIYKVKRLQDGTPVLFLEKPVNKKGRDYRKHFLTLLHEKAALIEKESGVRPIVMEQLRGKKDEGDVRDVYGIGAFTDTEYVEPVHGIRRAPFVRHRGRVVTLDDLKNMN